MQGSVGRRIGRLAWLTLAAAWAAVPAAASAAATGDPDVNRSLSPATEGYCAQDPSSNACIDSALADINAAHAAEGVPAMILPSNFASMTVSVQLMNLANLERVGRGLAPIVGLSAALNRDAQAAAEQNRDPVPSNFYGDVSTGNWVAGDDSALEADFEWMYDDGPGSGNLDCTSSDPSGCWGHRTDILWPFSAPIAMGAGVASGQYGTSMTELFVGGDTRAEAGQPDAPVVQPSPPSGVTAGSASGTSAGIGSPSGRAAGGRQPMPRPSVGAVVPTRGGVNVTVSCTGARATTCRLKLTLTVAAAVRGGRLVLSSSSARAAHVTVAAASVVLPSGQTQQVSLRLDRVARRVLTARDRVRATLLVVQRGKAMLTHVVTVRRSL